MIDGIKQCAVAMEAAQRQLEVAAENLANAETDGFHQHLVRSRAMRGGLEAAGAPMRTTGRPFDLTVSGPGGLRVASGSRSESEHAVSVRSASFRRDSAGHLVDGKGRVLLGASGPLRVDENVTVRSDGTFVRDGRVLGRVPLAPGAELHSGVVSASDVNPIGEMIEVLDAQRSFETAQKSLSAIDATRQKSTNDVGQIHE
jgi:flagellar basal body rod protein FlgG